MSPAMTEEIAFLRSIRGTFTDKPRARYGDLFYVFLFGIGLPAWFAFVLVHDRVSRWPLTADQWTLVLLIPGSFFLGWLFWHFHGTEYEFTGTGVILRRRGKTKRTIAFDDIERMDVTSGSHGYSRLLLEGKGTRIAILLYPSLRQEILRINTERGRGANALPHVAHD